MKAVMSSDCDRLELVAQSALDRSLLELIRRRFSGEPDPVWPGPKPVTPERCVRWIQKQVQCGRDPEVLGSIIHI